MSWLTNATVTSVAEKDAQAKEAKRQDAKRKRDTALQAMTYTFGDGAVVQTRPQDMPSFQTAISVGLDQKWIMADNSVRLTTTTEMQAAVDSAVAQAQTIWGAYADELALI